MKTFLPATIEKAMQVDFSELSAIQIILGISDRQTATQGHLSTIGLASYLGAALRQDGLHIDGDRLWLEVFEPAIYASFETLGIEDTSDTWKVPLSVAALSTLRWLSGTGELLGLVDPNNFDGEIQRYWDEKQLKATSKVVEAVETIFAEFIIEASQTGQWGLSTELIEDILRARNSGEEGNQIKARAFSKVVGLKPLQ